MEEMRDKKNFLCQDPGIIIKTILEMNSNEINLPKNNNIPGIINNINIYDEESVRKEFEQKIITNSNIISDNFAFTLITKIKCDNCSQLYHFQKNLKNHTSYQYEQIFVINLFPPEISQVLPPEDLKIVFYFYILDDVSNKKFNKKCQNCGFRLNIS